MGREALILSQGACSGTSRVCLCLLLMANYWCTMDREAAKVGTYYTQTRKSLRAHLGTQLQVMLCTFSIVYLGELGFNENASNPSTRSRHSLSPV